MTSLYRGYTIDHDRTHAHAWKGEKSNRTPDVVTQDLPSAMQVIDVIREDEDRHRAENPVVPI